jgi:hypothetical protein
VKRGEGLRHGCVAEDPGRIRRILRGRSRLLRKLWADMVYVCVYGDPAAGRFMCKGEALLRLTMHCQCYAERQLKVAGQELWSFRPAAICDSAAEELPSAAKGGLMSAGTDLLLQIGG